MPPKGKPVFNQLREIHLQQDYLDLQGEMKEYERFTKLLESGIKSIELEIQLQQAKKRITESIRDLTKQGVDISALHGQMQGLLDRAAILNAKKTIQESEKQGTLIDIDLVKDNSLQQSNILPGKAKESKGDEILRQQQEVYKQNEMPITNKQVYKKHLQHEVEQHIGKKLPNVSYSKLLEFAKKRGINPEGRAEEVEKLMIKKFEDDEEMKQYHEQLAEELKRELKNKGKREKRRNEEINIYRPQIEKLERLKNKFNRQAPTVKDAFNYMKEVEDDDTHWDQGYDRFKGMMQHVGQQITRNEDRYQKMIDLEGIGRYDQAQMVKTQIQSDLTNIIEFIDEVSKQLKIKHNGLTKDQEEETQEMISTLKQHINVLSKRMQPAKQTILSDYSVQRQSRQQRFQEQIEERKVDQPKVTFTQPHIQEEEKKEVRRPKSTDVKTSQLDKKELMEVFSTYAEHEGVSVTSHGNVLYGDSKNMLASLNKLWTHRTILGDDYMSQILTTVSIKLRQGNAKTASTRVAEKVKSKIASYLSQLKHSSQQQHSSDQLDEEETVAAPLRISMIHAGKTQ